MISEELKKFDLQKRLLGARQDVENLKTIINVWGKNHAYAAPVYMAVQVAEQRIDNLLIALEGDQ